VRLYQLAPVSYLSWQAAVRLEEELETITTLGFEPYLSVAAAAGIWLVEIV
jgi:hypothetical protein